MGSGGTGNDNDGNAPSSHTECDGNARCVSIAGPGQNQCQTDESCRRQETYSACRNFQCVQVIGTGGDQCVSDADCGVRQEETRTQSQEPQQQLLQVQTPQTQSQQSASPEPIEHVQPEVATHRICAARMCVTIVGAGPDECASAADCLGEEGHSAPPQQMQEPWQQQNQPSSQQGSEQSRQQQSEESAASSLSACPAPGQTCLTQCLAAYCQQIGTMDGAEAACATPCGIEREEQDQDPQEQTREEQEQQLEQERLEQEQEADQQREEQQQWDQTQKTQNPRCSPNVPGAACSMDLASGELRCECAGISSSSQETGSEDREERSSQGSAESAQYDAVNESGDAARGRGLIPSIDDIFQMLRLNGGNDAGEANGTGDEESQTHGSAGQEEDGPAWWEFWEYLW